MKNKLKTIISFIITTLAIIIFLIVQYMNNSFGNLVSEMFYYITSGVKNSGGNVFIEGIKSSLIPLILLLMILQIPILGFKKYEFLINIKIKKKIFQISLPIKHKIIYSLILLVISLGYFYIKCDVASIIKNTIKETKIYEKYYVDSKDVNIKFNDKRNLILIFAESLESTFISKENGGLWDYSVIEELETLALSNTNFSHNSKVGGYYSTTGATWTVGGLVAQTSGISMARYKNNEIIKDKPFLEGAYTLGDILKENNYNLEIMMGSSIAYGNRKDYFKEHGNYKMFDYDYALDKKLVNEKIWWGYEDYKLFDFAKKELLKLEKEENPFNLILLTADTHFINGCSECIREEYKQEKYTTTYENVYSASSKEITSFINWIQDQSFYKDTTIVIVGDHISMQNKFFNERNISQDERTIYNVFINSDKETKNTKNRLFSAYDIYPTILSSIGAEIEGEKLGFGTNLYSSKKTLYEELGKDYVSDELKKYSKYFEENIVKN